MKAILEHREATEAERLRVIREKQETDAKVMAEEQGEDNAASRRRQRGKETASVLLCQMDAKTEKEKVHEVFMTPVEQAMNRRLLEAAARTVGEPRQLKTRVF
mmetsp:Transcript_31168/g.56593  ORF Transcript_31168/g.56593 Transcript_31168/m.56593 type:complete len:103 (-) Transcript_31168:460-768(-)